MVPLLAEEANSVAIAELLGEDEEMIVWWGTWTECAVAINRLTREGRLNEEGGEEARTVLDRLTQDWREVEPTDDVRLLAALLSKRHPLKAADILQVAAALVWCEGATEGRGFVCLDDRLRRAASNEGFEVLPRLAEEEEA